jgi:hypothetical protein
MNCLRGCPQSVSVINASFGAVRRFGHVVNALEAAKCLVEAGSIRPHLDPRRFRLNSVGEAYAALTTCTARGRLVVDVGNAA